MSKIEKKQNIIKSSENYQTDIFKFITKITSLDCNNHETNEIESLDDLYVFIKNIIESKNKSILHINNNYIGQLKDKDKYIQELGEQNSKELDFIKYELEQKNILINDLKKNIRNQIFLNDDKDYIIFDLEKEIINLKKLNYHLSNEIKQDTNKNDIIESEKNELIQKLNSKLKRQSIEQLKNIKKELDQQFKYNNKISESIIINYL